MARITVLFMKADNVMDSLMVVVYIFPNNTEITNFCFITIIVIYSIIRYLPPINYTLLPFDRLKIIRK